MFPLVIWALHGDCCWGIAEIKSIRNAYLGVFPLLLQTLFMNSGDPAVLAIVQL